MCKEAVEVIHQKLALGGELRIATDVDNYATHVEELMGRLTLEGRLIFSGGKTTKRKAWRETPTKYEKRGLNFGHSVHDFVYVKGSS